MEWVHPYPAVYGSYGLKEIREIGLIVSDLGHIMGLVTVGAFSHFSINQDPPNAVFLNLKA
jgi:hypothetical protein